jgi:hypothetical protein
MKKSLSALLALTFALGVTGTSFAAGNSTFSDVPANHWSYNAISQLAKDGIIEGYQDGTYHGEHILSRYEMAMIVSRAMTKMEKANDADKALIKKLDAEYSTEIDKLNDKYDKLDKRVDNVMLSGFVRSKYDSDTSNGRSTNVNKHFYMDFEGTLKVNDTWAGHFQSETRANYMAHNNSYGATEQYGTYQRIWTTGKIGDIGVTLGKKWWGYGFQNVIFGHVADGVQLDCALTPKVNASIFNLRPTSDQGDLMDLGIQPTLDKDGKVWSTARDANIYGVNLASEVLPNLNANLVVAGNDDKDKQMMSKWGSFDLSTKMGPDWKVTATYAKTNADNFNHSTEFRLDYKQVDLQKPGSLSAYLRVINFEKYGDASHDDEWGSLPSDMKGWILGVVYVPYKNVQWETFYSDQKLNISGTNGGDYNYGNGAVKQNAKRKLIRSQLDVHF